MNDAKPLVSDNHSARMPVLLAFIAAVLWGLWWMPIRWLNAQGLDGAWGSVAMNAGAAVAMLVWIMTCRLPLSLGARTIAGAALVGVAAATYSVALNLSDVVRVILLFYLAPAWSKIIEWAFLGRPWGWSSTITIALSLAGAFMVLGGNLSLVGLNAGDILALLSGVSWSVGATFLFTGRKAHAASLTFFAAVSAICVSGLFLTFAPSSLVAIDTFTTSTFGKGAMLGLIYVTPILFLTMWSAQKLRPAVLTFLLTAEILSGVISGAIFLDEPFGWMQATGAMLILLAAAGEVLPHLRAKEV